MDSRAKRSAMVLGQITTWDVFDPRVLQVMQMIPREHFVPDKYVDFAFADTDIPLQHNQFMLSPKVVGRMLDALRLTGVENVLEVGTGSGYVTTLLSKLAKSVESIEYFEDLANHAKTCIHALHVYNAEIKKADLFQDFRASNSFNAIVVTGAVNEVPKSLLSALAINGILVAPVGKWPAAHVVCIKKEGDNIFNKEYLFETSIASLIGEPDASEFVL